MTSEKPPVFLNLKVPWLVCADLMFALQAHSFILMTSSGPGAAFPLLPPQQGTLSGDLANVQKILHFQNSRHHPPAVATAVDGDQGVSADALGLQQAVH